MRLDEVVLRALEKEPEQRYQHASDVKADVESVKQSPARVTQSRAESPPTASSSLGQETGAATRKMFRESRLSWCALSGTVLAPLVLLLPGFSVMAVHGPEPDWCRALGLPADLARFFLLAPFLTTILGVVAIVRIRRSEGRIRGMRLAVFDALFLPLLALDLAIIYSGGYALAVIYLTIASLSGDAIMHEPVFFRLVVVLLAGPVVWLDWRIVRGVSRLATTYQSPAAATPGMSVEKIGLWTLIRKHWHEPRPLQQMPVGRISLWASIAGLVAMTGLQWTMSQLLPRIAFIVLGETAGRIMDIIVSPSALLLGVVLEVAALRYGIDARRTRSGLAGLIVSAISLVLVALYCLRGLFAIVQHT